MLPAPQKVCPITEYQDADGNLAFASDKKYASVKKIKNEAGQTVEEYYFDEYGNPAKHSAGQYGLKREYNELGQNYIVTYVDADGNAILNTSGYSTQLRTYNDDNQMIKVMYLDIDDEPIKLSSGNYGTAYEYDAEGRQSKVIYLDKNGNPVQISGGYYGVEYERDADGRTTKVTYIDQNGKPVMTRSGYASLRRTFNDDGSVNTEFYLDKDDNPVMVNGGYGVKSVDGRRYYVDQNGNIMFSLNNISQNFPWIIVLLGIVLTIVATLLPRKLKIVFICLYTVFILSQTILLRETGGKLELTPFWSYSMFFSSYGTRLEIINNILLFMPFGAGLYSFFRKYWIILVPLCFSILIEAAQYVFSLGLCELDDVISNTLGAAIGMLMAVVVMEIMESVRLRKSNIVRDM